MSVIHATDANFASEIASGVTLVDFYADWCGPCQALAPAIEEIANTYQGRAKVVKLNVDQCPQATQTFGIMSIPTILVFQDGKLVEKSIGNVEKSELEGLLNKHLS